jgi:hypothetical protein
MEEIHLEAGPFEEADYLFHAQRLMEGEAGEVAPSPVPLPLKLMTVQRCVAWQWLEDGRLIGTVPIGGSKAIVQGSSSSDNSDSGG